MKSKRKCSDCGRCKNLNQFYKDHSKLLGREYRCKICSKRKSKIFRFKNPGLGKEYWKKYRLEKEFGLSIIEYNSLLRDQDSKCAICGNPFIKTPNIDHNHETGKIRGLLCRDCNLGIGYFGDNLMLIKKAINYLKKYSGD